MSTRRPLRSFALLSLLVAFLFIGRHAASRPPPSSWGITAWFLDPASGSDINDCVTSVTGCATFAEIVARWGTLSPVFTTTTGAVSITQVSTQTTTQGMADPIVLTPMLGGTNVNSGVTVTYQCTLPTPTAATLSNVISKVRTGSPGTGFQIQMSAGGALGAFVCNTTVGKTSCAWAYAAGNGSRFRMTQPLTAWTNNVTTPMTVEVDTWANGDTVNVYSSLSLAHISKIRPSIQYMGPNEGGFVVVNNCYIPFVGNENNGDMTVDVGPNVALADGRSDLMIGVSSPFVNDNGSGQGSSDWIYQGSFSGGFWGDNGLAAGAPNTGHWQIFGGMVGTISGSQFPSPHFDGVQLDADVILAGGTSVKSIFTGSNIAGLVQDDAMAVVASGVLDTTTYGSFTSPSNLWWSRTGTGVLDAGHGDVWYNTGATGGATQFPSVVLKESAGQVACKFVPSATVTTLLCNLAVAAGANLDANLGATAGCLCAGARGCFCNTGF